MFCVLLLNTITIRYFIWILIKECSFDSRGNIGYVVLEKKKRFGMYRISNWNQSLNQGIKS